MSYEIHIGDCLTSLRAMEDQSIHCCVTSPPYFGLRDYGVEGQIGLEDTPEEFVSRLVEVFREVRRVLRDDGTLWVNIGDSYARQGGRESDQPRHWDGRGKTAGSMHSTRLAQDIGLKPKDLIGIPWMLAFALRADGWYLRQDIIWHKPNPMPESVRDRCTKAHEYIFLMSKSDRYFFDSDAIKVPASGATIERNSHSFSGAFKGQYKGTPGEKRFQDGKPIEKPNFSADGKANKRSVWSVTVKPYRGAHFATFPPDLIEPCILAGCPAGGTVLDPFGGSGTTAGVAVKHGRKAILCELNPEYVELVKGRVFSIAGDQIDMFGAA